MNGHAKKASWRTRPRLVLAMAVVALFGVSTATAAVVVDGSLLGPLTAAQVHYRDAPQAFDQGDVDAATAVPAQGEACPGSVAAGELADAARLMELNGQMHDFGPRPTATPNHQRFVKWIQRRLHALPGVDVESIPMTIQRQIEKGAELTAGLSGGSLGQVALAGPVPYSEPTGGNGVEAPLVYIPPGEAISPDQAAGRIVIRDSVPGTLPRAAFLAVSWFMHDPDLSMAKATTENYERDWIGFTRNAELAAAADAGAAGIVFVHGFPLEQVRGQYAPYNGVFWELPGVYVGVDEGEHLKELASRGGRARMKLTASRGPAKTETLKATLPGLSDERIAVTSHTDGINAVWDNGPIAMLAMLEHFAAVPIECRPRTLEFTFTTAHLFLSQASAEDYAAELDEGYDDGTVALAIALEHLGAREYEAVPRPGGGPGRSIEPTGRTEQNTFFVGESPFLAGTVANSIVENDLARSYVLRGADVPGPHLPPHHSFGGEGTAYHGYLVPTVAFVTGPWTLFNPSFGMEAVDGELFHEQLTVFTDLIYELDDVPREVIAGAYLAEREARSPLCATDDHGHGLAWCRPGDGE